MKTTILGGVLFLVPVVFIAIILGKAYEVSMLVAEPLDRFIPVEHIGGVAFANILAIVLIVVLCFVAGLTARSGLFSKQIDRLDGLLINVMPGYAVMKNMIGSFSASDDVTAVLRPVLARFDDYDQIAFELERTDTHATLFLPGAPSAWSGSSVIVDIARVRPLDLPIHQAVKLLRVLGRGSLALADAAPAAAMQEQTTAPNTQPEA